MYIIEEDHSEIIDYDRNGNPIYGDIIYIYHPINCEIEPYSSELAQSRLGLFAEVTHRAFCYPDNRLTLNTPIRYDGEDRYRITELLRYDKHYEVLIKKD